MIATIFGRSSSFSGRIRRFIMVLFFLVPGFFVFSHLNADAQSGIINTKHNLSVSGPGPIKSYTEDRICVFCHTPHNAYQLNPANAGTGTGSAPIAPEEYTYLPLWNHEVTTQPTALFYSSSTLKASLSQPTGPTKLCLSCHDGTVALGTIASGANLGIPGTLKDYPPTYGNPNTNFGTDLSGHHPVSFPYSSSLPNPELASIDSLPSSLTLFSGDEVHCTTCHNPHDDTNGNFLVMDNSSSQLCTACHILTGWNVAAHDQCENCHTPHFAVPPGEWLLNFSSYDACLTGGCHSSDPVHTVMTDIKSQTMKTSGNLTSPGVRGLSQKAQFASRRTDASEKACAAACHGSEQVNTQSPAATSNGMQTALLISPKTGAKKDIKSQIMKISSHRSGPNARILSPRAQLALRRSGMNQVTCVDCHNPHLTNKNGKASAPRISGVLQGVSGLDRNGVEVEAADYEYEICFKCHSDAGADFSYIPRVIGTTNLRLAFDPGNASYHPVVEMGKTMNVPSIPSTFNLDLRATSRIYCTDCHHDDAGGSRGPHGSSFAPILGERYETADGTRESFQNYALCYRCHNRDSILGDNSFKKNSSGKGGHSGHLAAGTPCSACHDPHGVNLSSSSGDTGDHTHLINFDTTIVSPKPGNVYPIFKSNGIFSGNCTLVCHGKLHDNESYPQGAISTQSLSPLSPGLRVIRKIR